MKNNVTAIALVAIFLACIELAQAQTTTLRYGQIPSTAKSVSALHFSIAQRKGLFVHEGIVGSLPRFDSCAIPPIGMKS